MGKDTSELHRNTSTEIAEVVPMIYILARIYNVIELYCSVDISAAFCPLSCIHFIYIPIYRKTSDRSRAPGRRRAPHTGRGSDSLVPIEAGPLTSRVPHISRDILGVNSVSRSESLI